MAGARGSIRIACREIISKLLKGEDDLHQLKAEAARKYSLDKLPTNPQILSVSTQSERDRLLPILRLKPTRSLSGVNVVAVMTPPHPCPHGRCAYCPSVQGVPNSYTGKEPSAMRGLQNKYDPYKQVNSRIAQLKSTGHSVSKVELIVQGGTFPAMDRNIQEGFVKGCLDAITGVPTRTLAEAQYEAEKSRIRNVGITFETRPDRCSDEDVDRMLGLGVTRLELGVQTIHEDIYDLVERGHRVEDVIHSTRRLRDAGLKICYHMMPGLPGSDLRRDMATFEEIFASPDYRPDMLKIYPCLVLEGTKIHDWWMKGGYQPYSTQETVELLSMIKAHVPPWVRIMRVQRDIPAQLIVAGVKKSNLRQLIHEHMKMQELVCHCIRCREIGRQPKQLDHGDENIRIATSPYEAGNGKEFFISAEDTEGTLIAYLRLRLPSMNAERSEVAGKPTSLVRELHVYGPVVPLEEHHATAWQHRGYGRTLLDEAELLSSNNGVEQILVTSGLGVRDYFRRHGYERVGHYMGKAL